MQKIGGTRRLVRAIGVGVLFGSLFMGFGVVASNADELSTTPTDSPTSTSAATPTPEQPSTGAKGSLPAASVVAPAAANPPYGTSKPVTLETDFSRPFRALSNHANSDFSLLDDLERLIQGSYQRPSGHKFPRSVTSKNYVYMSISRMPGAHRVARTLIAAAKAGVKVRVIHGEASQSNASHALQRVLNGSGMRDAQFKICRKGKSLACLSSLNGAIMHSKILLVNHTFTRAGDPANSAIWSGSANLGGVSAEQTFNNGLTIYNDKKLWAQSTQLWADMYAERNIHNDYLEYVKDHSGRYGYSGATSDGYSSSFAKHGMFYSNLAKVAIYPTPIAATPTNGKDPVMNLLNRIIPDDQCRIRLQENRFKYRRIGVALKLVELANKGCKVSVVSFEDNLKINRILHCQQYIRICRPILDVFKTANRHIETAWAKPHDKTIMVEALLTHNRLNREEVSDSGKHYSNWPSGGVRTKLVQAGSAALTGSNLVVSDEITTETTDRSVYDDYLDHWKAISKSHEIHNYAY